MQMIKFTLECSNDHVFESWFSSSAEYDRLAGEGYLSCPHCGDASVTKSLMAPNVRSTKGRETGSVEVAEVNSEPSGMPAAADQSPVAALPALPPQAGEEFVRQLRELKKHVIANSENVGSRFAEEARAIHYGEKEARGIFGSAKPEEAIEMIEEGIEFLPLPDLPEEKN